MHGTAGVNGVKETGYGFGSQNVSLVQGGSLGKRSGPATAHYKECQTRT